MVEKVHNILVSELPFEAGSGSTATVRNGIAPVVVTLGVEAGKLMAEYEKATARN